MLVSSGYLLQVPHFIGGQTGPGRLNARPIMARSSLSPALLTTQQNRYDAILLTKFLYLQNRINICVQSALGYLRYKLNINIKYYFGNLFWYFINSTICQCLEIVDII